MRSVDLSIDLALQGSPNSHPSEELLKQPDYSDKIKQMLGNYQGLGEEACSACSLDLCSLDLVLFTKDGWETDQGDGHEYLFFTRQ